MAKTKTLISCAVTAQLICVFVFAYMQKIGFSNLIAGMLEDGTEDFSTSEDLFDAIGPLLGQVDDTKSDDDIREICDRLYNLVTKG